MNNNNKASAQAALVRRPLTVAVAILLAGAGAQRAQALEFGTNDGWHGTFNTTLSYGVDFRVADPDPDLIAKAHYNPLVGLLGNAQERAAKGAFSANHDDGDLNYSKGSAFSNAVKVTSELAVNYGDNFGGFFRGSYFYDFATADSDKLTKLARDQVGEKLRLLDAFVFGKFTINDQQGQLRLGKQVLSWGESTFIQGGINAINPIDVSQLHVAGAELKDALLPINMLWGTYNFSQNFSVEATYLLEFAQTIPDPDGTYFSTNDIATLGATYASLPFGLVPQPVINPENYYNVCFGGAASDNPAYGGASVLAAHSNPLAELLSESCNQTVRRGPDRYPGEYGQWGVAAHWFAEGLNNTEFGFYYLDYSSRLPLISAATTVINPSPTSAEYIVEYPRHIHLFGISFNTQFEGPGIALQGELSYRPNQPLQIDDVELLYAGLSPLNELIPAPANRFYSQLGVFGAGQPIQGYTRNHVTQLQFTATKVFGPNNIFHADQIAMVAEVGATNADIPPQDELRYNGDGTDTGGGPDALMGILTNPQTQEAGFPTRFSWGYRVAARADYNSVFGSAFTLSPRIAFYHDVNGISPGPGGAFIEDRKQITVGAEANYLNKWSFDLSYTNYFGAGDLNLINDRDFVAFVVKYSF
jgi:hypothetical protein